MKRVIRNAGVGVMLTPLIALIYLTAAFCGKDRAVTMLGPFVTALARLSLKLWVPQIKTAEQFDEFPAKMKKNMRRWRLFYDIRIVEETKDRFKLNIANCPFCEVLQIARLSGLASYVCQGDWDVANENRDRWIFEREHQIGTGDPFCDHTYKRKKQAGTAMHPEGGPTAMHASRRASTITFPLRRMVNSCCGARK